jgi:hypothetical protein
MAPPVNQGEQTRNRAINTRGLGSRGDPVDRDLALA